MKHWLGCLFIAPLLVLSACDDGADEATALNDNDPQTAAPSDGALDTPTPGDDPTATPDEPGLSLSYYRDIKPILDTMCVHCHTEGAIQAEIPLDNYEDVQMWAEAIRQQTSARLMPPWRTESDCAEYEHDESLTEDELATIDSWVDQGAPAGDADVSPAPARSVTRPSLSRIDTRVAMPVTYTPTQSPDDYRCFLIPWEGDKTQYVTGLGFEPGNPAVVHHVITYLITPEATAPFIAWNEEDPEPGYTCFGGPTGPGGDSGLSQGVHFLGGWAPGGLGGDFPSGTGLKIEPGSMIAFQVHYNTMDGQPEPDLSQVVLKLDDTVEHEAMIMPWTNPQWVMGGAMPIPAGEKDVMHSWGYDMSQALAMRQGLPVGSIKRVEVHSAALHMHLRGTSGRTYIARSDGEDQCLLDIPNYDFGWQRNYGFIQPYEMVPGDQLMIECHWDNSEENQPWVDGARQSPQDLNWGEGSYDEMCVGFFYVVGHTE